MKYFIRSFFILDLSIHLQKNCTKSFRARKSSPPPDAVRYPSFIENRLSNRL